MSRVLIPCVVDVGGSTRISVHTVWLSCLFSHALKIGFHSPKDALPKRKSGRAPSSRKITQRCFASEWGGERSGRGSISDREAFTENRMSFRSINTLLRGYSTRPSPLNGKIAQQKQKDAQRKDSNSAELHKETAKVARGGRSTSDRWNEQTANSPKALINLYQEGIDHVHVGQEVDMGREPEKRINGKAVELHISPPYCHDIVFHIELLNHRFAAIILQFPPTRLPSPTRSSPPLASTPPAHDSSPRARSRTG